MGVYIGEPYMEVEYIQSSGTQYINTNLRVNGDFTTEIKYAKTTNVAWNTLIGTRDGSKSRYLIRNQTDVSTLMFQRNYNNTTTGSLEQYSNTSYYNNNIHTIKFNRYVYIDGTLLKTFTASTTTGLFPNPLLIFGINYDNPTVTDFGYYKLYYMKIWDNNNNLVRDFIPCYKTSNNEIGLFDKVENKFYANSGTGTFTKGNDVKLFQPELKNAYIGYVKEYTLDGSTVPNTDTNVYVDIAQSGYTISRVVLEGSVTYSGGATYSSDFWCRLSYTNNSQTRWGLGLPFGSIHQNGSSASKRNPGGYGKVDGRYQNGATTIFKAMSSNAGVQVGTDTFRLEIGENGAICTVNSDTETWTYTTAEKQIISSIFGSSTAKFYASRSNTSGYGPVINGNIIATVSYS